MIYAPATFRTGSTVAPCLTAHKGIFITTSDYTSEALTYGRSVPQKVMLVDGERLAEFLIDHNVGVTVAETYQVKRLDKNYFA